MAFLPVWPRGPLGGSSSFAPAAAPAPAHALGGSRPSPTGAAGSLALSASADSAPYYGHLLSGARTDSRSTNR